MVTEIGSRSAMKHQTRDKHELSISEPRPQSMDWLVGKTVRERATDIGH